MLTFTQLDDGQSKRADLFCKSQQTRTRDAVCNWWLQSWEYSLDSFWQNVFFQLFTPQVLLGITPLPCFSLISTAAISLITSSVTQKVSQLKVFHWLLSRGPEKLHWYHNPHNSSHYKCPCLVHDLQFHIHQPRKKSSFLTGNGGTLVCILILLLHGVWHGVGTWPRFLML